MDKRLDENQREELENKIKEQIENHNKLLKNIFIILGGVIVIFLLVYLGISSMRNFEYKGVDFEIEKYCDAKPCLTFYKTSIPINYKDSVTGKIIDADYNIYLRNNPEDLEDVLINGEVNFRENMVLDINTENLFCDGDWVIAIGNLQNLHILGINLIAKNESEIRIYVPAEQFMYVDIRESNETSIEQLNENTYNLNVNNCEILKATERLMLEAFIQANN